MKPESGKKVKVKWDWQRAKKSEVVKERQQGMTRGSSNCWQAPSWRLNTLLLTPSDLSDSGYKGSGVLEIFAAAAFIVVLSRPPNLCDTNAYEQRSSESGSQPVCQMSKVAVLQRDTMWVTFLTAPPLVE